MNKKSQVLHDLRPGMGINITLHANLNKYLSSHIFIVLFHTKIAFNWPWWVLEAGANGGVTTVIVDIVTTGHRQTSPLAIQGVSNNTQTDKRMNTHCNVIVTLRAACDTAYARIWWWINLFLGRKRCLPFMGSLPHQSIYFATAFYMQSVVENDWISSHVGHLWTVDIDKHLWTCLLTW